MANVALLEIHRQIPDLDHGRLQVPHDDRHVNTAVHRGGSAHPASPAGRAQNLKKWAECKRRINKNLEGKCTGPCRGDTQSTARRTITNRAASIGIAPSRAGPACAARIGPGKHFVSQWTFIQVILGLPGAHRINCA
ncbi:hypothetical protein FPJ27_02365 [Burkholderia sp. MS455]|nr:hypothetical protein FPJ27_02365 [Burkholderia sp. MS455]